MSEVTRRVRIQNLPWHAPDRDAMLGRAIAGEFRIERDPENRTDRGSKVVVLLDGATLDADKLEHGATLMEVTS